MDTPVTNPHLAEDGVVFSVRISDETRDCFIGRETLLMLSELKGLDAADAETLEIFLAFEQSISGAALQRLAEEGGEAPLVIRLHHFHASGTSLLS